MYSAIDDFVMTNIKTYAGRTIQTAEAENIDLGDGDATKEDQDKEGETTSSSLSKADAEDLCEWFKESALPSRVKRELCWPLAPYEKSNSSEDHIYVDHFG